MIDFFLDKNPADADLLVLKDRWRVRKGDLGGLIEQPDDPAALREACWRIVAATRKGNPEEWEALLFAGDPERARTLLAASTETGTEEDRRLAAAMLARLDAPPDGAPEEPRDVPLERLLVALRSSDPDQVIGALNQMAARGMNDRALVLQARKLWEDETTPFDVRYRAASALLATGDEKPRKALRADLLSGDLRRSVAAGTVLVEQPGDGEKALTELLKTIEKEESVGRARPTLMELGLTALAARKEPGAREYLEAKLASPDYRIDAARALGVLGDAKAVPALVKYVTSPPPEDEDTTSGGLGFLGGAAGGARDVAIAEALRPALAGALAILRLTAGK